MKKIILPVLLILVVVASISASSFARADPIILVENPWTASSLNVNVAKLILENEMGYEVEIILLDESTQWAAIGAGAHRVTRMTMAPVRSVSCRR